MSVTVRKAETSDMEACWDVRREVFIEGQDVPPDLEVDGLDPICTHFIALHEAAPNTRAVGTARLRITEDGIAKAERVAVKAEVRGLGIGHLLMDALETEAQRQGYDEVVLSAQVPVIPFYERRGYVPEGPVYLDAGIEHRTMRRRWPKT